MALSARATNTKIGTWAINAEMVVLDITDTSGMLRLLGGFGNHGGSSGNNQYSAKIEIDGVIVFNDILAKAFSVGGASLGIGMPVNVGTTVSNVMGLFNMPFSNSLKITIMNKTIYQYSLVEFMTSYVIDLQ